MHKQTLELANKIAAEIQTANDNIEILKTALEKAIKSTCKYQGVSIREYATNRPFECIIPNEDLIDVLKANIKNWEVILKTKEDEFSTL